MQEKLVGGESVVLEMMVVAWTRRESLATEILLPPKSLQSVSYLCLIPESSHHLPLPHASGINDNPLGPQSSLFAAQFPVLLFHCPDP